MRLPKTAGAIDEALLNAMNEAIASLAGEFDTRCELFFDDVYTAEDGVTGASLIYSEPHVNFSLSIAVVNFDDKPASEAFLYLLRKVYEHAGKEKTEAEIEAIARRLKRKF